MPIQVTCPGCFTRFTVSDSFAGKMGPCPKCKAKIKVPEKTEEIVIHAPKAEGPVDSKGRAVLKPIRRQETKVRRKDIIVGAAAVLTAIIAAIVVRAISLEPPLSSVIYALGAILLAPPLVWAGYGFVRDSELEPYRGKELLARIAICSAVFALLWLLYVFIPPYVLDRDGISEVSPTAAAICMVVLALIGGFASMGAFELEFLGGMLHVGFYLVVTVLLALLAGAQLAAPLGGAA